MSIIIVWGVSCGKCRPMAGEGFREVFSSSTDVDTFVQLQCNKIPRSKLHNYAIYITNEFCSLDRLMHYHNWLGSDAPYRDRDLKVEVVNIEEVKNHIDIEYQLHKQRQDSKKLAIKKEVNNMSSDERLRQAKMFKDIGLI